MDTTLCLLSISSLSSFVSMILGAPSAPFGMSASISTASAHSWSRMPISLSLVMFPPPLTCTTQNLRSPVSSLRNTASFVVPANTHWRGWSSLSSLYAPRNRSLVFVMNDLMAVDSLLRNESSSWSSTTHDPASCSSTDLSRPTAEMLPLNHFPPSTSSSVDLPMPCGPVSMRQ